MNIRKTLPIMGLAIAAVLLLAPAGSASASEVCAGLDSGKIDTTGDPASVTITASSGNQITGYCVKAGTEPVYVTVDPPVDSLVITHPSGKAVSHYSWSEAPVQTTTTSTTTTTTTTEPPPTSTTIPVTTTTEVICVDPPPAGQDPCGPTTEPPCEGICGPATPPSTDPPVTTDCVDFETGERWPLGEYVILDPDEVTNFYRSVELSGQPCEPKTDDPPAVPAAPVDPPAPDEPLILAATGPSLTWMLVAVALAAVAAGAGAVIVARRPEVEA